MSASQPEEVLTTRTVFQGRIISVRVDTVRLPSGRTTTREVVVHPGAVVVVAPDDQGRVAMVRQYRPAIGRETLELPAGTREPAETAEACAARELAEEVGVQAAQWQPLVEFYSSPGFCTELLSVFLATRLSPAPAHPEEDEAIRREWIDLSAVPDLIARGVLVDAKTIAGLLVYLQRNASGGAAWRA